MKRLILILLALLPLVAVSAKDAVTPLVIQLGLADRSLLPSETIELKLKQLKWDERADARFVAALDSVLRQVADVDEDNYIYWLRLTPEGNAVTIEVNSVEAFTVRDMNDKGNYGVLPVDRSRFVVKETDANKPLLRKLFKKDGKHNIVQEYEFLDYRRMRRDAYGLARWENGGLQVVTIFVNGEEQTRKP